MNPSLVRVPVAHGPPRLPGDAHDEDADPEPDQRVGDLKAAGDGSGAGDHREADVGIGARVAAVGDEGGAVERPPGGSADPRRQPVAGVTDQPGGGQRPKVIDVARVDQPMDSLIGSDGGEAKIAKTTK